MNTKYLPLMAIALLLNGCGSPGPWRGGSYSTPAYYGPTSGGNTYGTPSPSLYMTPGPNTRVMNYGGGMWSGSGTTPSGNTYNCYGAYGGVSCY